MHEITKSYMVTVDDHKEAADDFFGDTHYNGEFGQYWSNDTMIYVTDCGFNHFRIDVCSWD